MTDQMIDQRVAGADRRATPPAVDRRKADDAVLVLVQLVHADVQKLKVKIDEVRTDESLALAEAVAALMTKSFPEGDADGHRKAHEEQMAAIEARAKFWKSMLFEITKYGLLGVVGWLALRIWTAFLAGPAKS